MIRRPFLVAAAFAASALVLAGALGWITAMTLDLERAEVEALQHALQEENIRVALWRMDAALAGLIARENGRPADGFRDQVPGSEPGGGSRESRPAATAEDEGGASAGDPALVRARFEVGADRVLRAEPAMAAPAWLARLEVPQSDPEPAPAAAVVAPVRTAALGEPPSAVKSPAALDVPKNGPDETGQQTAYSVRDLNTLSFEQRQELSRLNTANFQSGQQTVIFGPEVGGSEPPPIDAAPVRLISTPPAAPAGGAPLAGLEVVPPAPRPALAAPRLPAFRPPAEVESAFQAAWMDGDLVLLRRVRRGGARSLQGTWLDWEGVREWLLDGARGVVPGSDLAVAAGETDPGRRLALAPLRLVPGPMPRPRQPAWTPVRLSLAAAWAAAAVGLAGVGALLLGSVRLAQRRAAFVSAVSHELRTPLTTFRLYTEMLAGGMVGGADRSTYLARLKVEADRLGHLVDNVLAFSRLERRPAAGRLAAVPLGELLARARPRLAERAAEAGLTLAVEIPPEAAAERVRADPAAVEQVLFNVVDNACKYGRNPERPQLHLEARLRGPRAVVELRDHGPGVAAGDRSHLFRPFHKSAARAAASAPGVGLGLALARRLARGMGGDLQLAASEGGAAFELTLRRAPPSLPAPS